MPLVEGNDEETTPTGSQSSIGTSEQLGRDEEEDDDDEISLCPLLVDDASVIDALSVRSAEECDIMSNAIGNPGKISKCRLENR